MAELDGDAEAKNLFSAAQGSSLDQLMLKMATVCRAEGAG